MEEGEGKGREMKGKKVRVSILKSEKSRSNSD